MGMLEIEALAVNCSISWWRARRSKPHGGERTCYRRDGDLRPTCDLRCGWFNRCGTQLTARCPRGPFF